MACSLFVVASDENASWNSFSDEGGSSAGFSRDESYRGASLARSPRNERPDTRTRAHLGVALAGNVAGSESDFVDEEG